MIDKPKVELIGSREACAFLLPKHYSGRKPNISIAFGLVHNEKLVAVLTVGKPASNSLCVGVCGKEHKDSVYELNRLCRLDEWKEPLSSFVSGCLRKLKSKDFIIVSYADTAMNHSGYIYQACNFIYTGATKRRTDKYTEGNKHSRHYDNDKQTGLRKVRSSKHRYIYFCTSNKKLRNDWKSSLRYKIEPYPKETNKKYKLGEYLSPQIVSTNE